MNLFKTVKLCWRLLSQRCGISWLCPCLSAARFLLFRVALHGSNPYCLLGTVLNLMESPVHQCLLVNLEQNHDSYGLVLKPVPWPCFNSYSFSSQCLHGTMQHCAEFVACIRIAFNSNSIAYEQTRFPLQWGLQSSRTALC